MQNQISFEDLVNRVFTRTKDYFTGYILNLFQQQSIILAIMVVIVLILTIINIFILVKNRSIHKQLMLLLYGDKNKKSKVDAKQNKQKFHFTDLFHKSKANKGEEGTS